MKRYQVQLWFIFSGWLIGLPVSQTVHSQAIWVGGGIRAKIHPMLTAELEQQVRFNDQFSQYSNTFTEASLRFRPWKHAGISAAYRYTNRPGSQRADDNDRQRWAGEAFYTIGSGDTQWIFSHRVRYQTAKEISVEDQDRKNYIRNRLGLAYNLTKRVQPYVAYEWFYRLNGKNEVQLNRFTMGIENRIGKSFGLDTFFRIDTEKNVKYPTKLFIIGITGTYRLNFSGKKKAETDQGEEVDRD